MCLATNLRFLNTTAKKPLKSHYLQFMYISKLFKGSDKCKRPSNTNVCAGTLTASETLSPRKQPRRVLKQLTSKQQDYKFYRGVVCCALCSARSRLTSASSEANLPISVDISNGCWLVYDLYERGASLRRPGDREIHTCTDITTLSH